MNFRLVKMKDTYGDIGVEISKKDILKDYKEDKTWCFEQLSEILHMICSNVDSYDWEEIINLLKSTKNCSNIILHAKYTSDMTNVYSDILYILKTK